MSNSLDWRKDAAAARLKGVSGGKSVLYAPEQAEFIVDHVMRAPESVLRRAMAAKSSAPANASPTLTVQRSANSSTSRTVAGKLTDETPDGENDVISVDTWDLSRAGSNLPSLFAHDPEQPTGQWSYPVKVARALLATNTFPEKGISPIADQVRGMVASGALRGISVGFKAGKIEFSKDPARPLGINFLSGHQLLEASFVSVGCNPSALVIGPTSAKAIEEYAMQARQAEVANLVSSLGKSSSGWAKSRPVPATTREQRLAEVRALINAMRR
jgi:hypothetical protein